MARRDTRSHIIDTALRVVARQGYEGTTLEDIAHAAGLTRPNLYYHFHDKQTLVLEALDRFAAAFRDEVIGGGLDRESDPIQAVTRCGDILAERQLAAGMAGGWLLGTLASELSDANEVFRMRLADLFLHWTHRIEGVLTKGVGDSILVASMPTGPAARFCVSSWEGAITITRNRREIMYLRDTNQMIALFLDGFRQAA